MLDKDKICYEISIKQKIIDWIEENKDENGNLQFTKKQIYLGIGLDKPNNAFNKAFHYLCYSKAEFVSYDKESKYWIWL